MTNSHYKDIINYELAEGVSEEQLLVVAGQVMEDWMKRQEGFLGWEINRDAEGNYSDIVYWRSRQDAQKAEKAMAHMPHAAEWFACYKPGSIKSRNLSRVAHFPL